MTSVFVEVVIYALKAIVSTNSNHILGHVLVLLVISSSFQCTFTKLWFKSVERNFDYLQK